MYVDPNGESLLGILALTMIIVILTVVLTSSKQQEATDSQIKQAKKAADKATLTLGVDKNGKQTINIQISLSDSETQFDPIADDYFYQELYDKACQMAQDNNLNEENSNLMTLQHIRWEYSVHKFGYETGISAIQNHCDPVDLNVDENIWTILKRGWNALWE